MSTLLKLIISTLLFTSVVNAAEYKIDQDHSTVGFKIKHLSISSVTGRFKTFEGKFNFDPSKPMESKAEAKINAGSISTENEKRDKHLQSDEFLDVKKFPAITFKSTKVEPVSAEEFKVHGDLTIHGVTKPVVLDTKYTGAAKDPWGNERAAFSATTKINRKDFGVVYNKVLETGGLLIGEDVDVTLEIEAIKVA